VITASEEVEQHSMGLSVAHANGQLNRGAACRYTITSAAQGLTGFNPWLAFEAFVHF